jgi:1-aminocyclopropane-1-carboxylate deaminase/D-cysteine desulfhydrase-like pyridoxal-dependent ACC family enzyme
VGRTGLTRRAFALGTLGVLAWPAKSLARGAPRPLLKAHPALASLPRTAIGSFPTPLEELGPLATELGIGALYVKRDDLSAMPYGGSKPRKLEFLLGDALGRGATLVATSGGAGSNQAVATTIYAKRFGMKTLLLLLPQTPSTELRESLLADHHYGAELRASPGPGRERGAAERIARRRGESLYVIPEGGSTPLGNAGFVNAAWELAGQVRAGLLPEPDLVYIAMGTMGSAVGLALGLKALGLRTRVVAVRASNPGTSSRAKFFAMAKQTAKFLRARDASFAGLDLASHDVVLDGRELGRGYALPTRRGRDAMLVAKRAAGLTLEPVYTAKTFAALIDDAPRLRDKVVLFWATHNSRPLDIAGTSPSELPRAFRAYFAGARR